MGPLGFGCGSCQYVDRTFECPILNQTEAYAERVHARIRRELGIAAKDLPGRALFAQGYQGSRYSFGYPACPNLEGNGPILTLLHGGEIGVHLSESHQMDPEYSTSALVALHPQARYFSA